MKDYIDIVVGDYVCEECKEIAIEHEVATPQHFELIEKSDIG